MGTLEDEQLFSNVRILSLGGESLIHQDVVYFNQHFGEYCVLGHCFGPLECLFCCMGFIRHGTDFKDGKIPIGYALKNKDVVLLDHSGEGLTEGAVGEIVVKSRFLSPGYWRKPEETQNAFLPDSDNNDKRMYLTGDLGHLSNDGCLTHAGRKDSQIKVRGFRIEVLEIEKAIQEIDGIEEAVVVGRNDRQGEMRLVGYYVSSGKLSIDSSYLRRHLANVLPEHMIPSLFVNLETMPLLPNGKIDRHRFPDPGSERPNLKVTFDGAKNQIEQTIAEIWRDVLDLNEIGMNDNFLDLGGDSLKAMRVVIKVRDAYEVELSMVDLITAASVRDIAKLIEKKAFG